MSSVFCSVRVGVGVGDGSFRFSFASKENLPERIRRVEIFISRKQPVARRLFRGSDPRARIVVLLVRLFGALRVANLALEVRVVLGFVVLDAIPEAPLGVGVDVHLDNTVANRLTDFFAGRTGAAVEDKVHRLVAVAARLFLDELLRVGQNLRRELDVTRGVDAVHVTERRSDGVEVRRDRLERPPALLSSRRPTLTFQ